VCWAPLLHDERDGLAKGYIQMTADANPENGAAIIALRAGGQAGRRANEVLGQLFVTRSRDSASVSGRPSALVPG
jgi:hypothetical protein